MKCTDNAEFSEITSKMNVYNASFFFFFFFFKGYVSGLVFFASWFLKSHFGEFHNFYVQYEDFLFL